MLYNKCFEPPLNKDARTGLASSRCFISKKKSVALNTFLLPEDHPKYIQESSAGPLQAPATGRNLCCYKQPACQIRSVSV